MDEMFVFKDWDKMMKELLSGIRFLLGLYSRSSAQNVKIRMRLYIIKVISQYYDSIGFSKTAAEILERYGGREERVIKDVRKNLTKASTATLNQLLSGVDSQEDILSDFDSLINELSLILRKRKSDFEKMLGSFSGQMIRYMLLWDCEDKGLTRYKFVTVGDSCAECEALDGKIFYIKDAQSGVNLAPMHPNCDCITHILDDNLNVVMTVGGKENEDFGLKEYDGYFTPFLRIPKDAWEMFKAYCAAQNERARNIKDPLTFLDWVTMGIVSSWWKNESKRANAAINDPTVYNIGNWVTMGLFDTIKGAINPDEPYSLEHILNSAALAGTVVGAVKVGQSVGGGKGIQELSKVADYAQNVSKNINIKVDISQKPVVSNSKLKNIIDDIYKGQDSPNVIGNGTTMDAVRNELKTGKPTYAKYHSIKMNEYLNGLNKRLRAKDLNEYDKAVINALIKDIENVKKGDK